MTRANATAHHTTTLSIRLFGAYDVRRDGEALQRTRSRKEMWLLALLALRTGQALDRDWLAGTLWPDAREDSALANLRRSLTDLRRVLGPDASRLSSPTPRSISLNLDGVAVDILEYDAAVLVNESSTLERAVELRSGPLLEGCCEEWVLPERERRDLSYLAALERLGLEYITQGNPVRAEYYLRQAIAIDPLRESAQRALLQALAARGAFAAASQVYRDHRLLLYRELNTPPAPETTALFEQIRTRGRMLATPSVANTGACSAPVHRQVPAPLNRLIGREGEVTEICARLASSRLVTLVGSGGVGKTRLAIHACEELVDRFPDGTYFTDLAALRDGSLIGSTVASSIEARELPGCSATAAVISALSNRSALLVLDNCEHLLDDCAKFASELLQQCGGLRILATSRGPLRVSGETTWRVPPLSLPPSDVLASIALAPPNKNLAAELLEYDAVRLFVERGIQANGSWRPDASNLIAIAEVCRRLDGIPLAIELAAARVRVLPVSRIAAGLDDRFRLLIGGSRDALPRHQTLRALLDWSYDLLPEEERRALRRLSVFADGWTLEAAEALLETCHAGALETLDLLEHLVDKSLVVYEDQAPGTRYHLLETVRQYGRDRLIDTGERETARELHCGFFVKVAEDLEPDLMGPGQIDSLARLEADHDNLRAALDYATETRNSETCLRLAGSLWRFWHIHGHLVEGRRRLLDSLAIGSAGPPKALRAKGLNGLAGLVLYLGEFELSRSSLEESLAIRRALCDERGIAIALDNLSVVLIHLGDFTSALAMNEEAISIHRRREDRESLAPTLSNAGYTSFKQGDCPAARAYMDEGLALSRALGDNRHIAHALDNLGDLERESGNFTKARSLHTEALTIFHEMGDRRLVAQCLEGLARIAVCQRDPRRAARLFGFEESLRESLGSPLPPMERKHQSISIDAARSDLGSAAFEQAWTDGRAMTLEHGIEYALGQ